MAEYIERTEELVLAMNAGARAIENTRRYHGAIYNKNVFSEDSQEIPYLLAAKVLREVSDAPAADVAPVVRCVNCKHLVAVNVNGKGISTCRVSGMEVAPDEFCSRGEKGRRCWPCG